MPDFYIAIQDLIELEEPEITPFNKESFDRLKSGAIQAIDKLKKGLSDKRLDESDSLMPLLNHPTTTALWEDVEFVLLLVEQKYIEYFKKHTSHLPSQPHDRLTSHYVISGSAGRIALNFLEKDSIPEYIQCAVKDAFQKTVEKYQKK